MINNKDFFKDPAYDYEAIRKELENIIDEGILTRGDARVHFDLTTGAGVVSADKHNKGFATINIRYANELVYQCHKNGLRTFTHDGSPTYYMTKEMIITLNIAS